MHLLLTILACWIPAALLLGLLLGRLMRGPRPKNTERRKK